MPTHDFTNWSLLLGRWRGVTLRLHIFFLLFAVVTLALSAGGPGQSLVGVGLLALSVLLVSLVLHELGHYFAARQLQIDVDEIVIGPFGSLTRPRLPAEPHEQMFVALAGPLMSLTLVVIGAITLVAAGQSQVTVLLNPVAPWTMFQHAEGWILGVKLVVWLNWMLFLLNLLPVFPFDGRYALRALLWPAVGRRTAAVHAARAGLVIAGLLTLTAFATRNAVPQSIVPLWLPQVILAIFLIFSAKQDLTESRESIGTDEWPDDDLPEDSDDSLSDSWLGAEEHGDAVLVEQWNEKREHREQLRREMEAREDAQVDRILQMLHEGGLDRLSHQDREVLNRASQRYRRRRKP